MKIRKSFYRYLRRNKAYGSRFKFIKRNRYKTEKRNWDPFASYDENGIEKMIFERNGYK